MTNGYTPEEDQDIREDTEDYDRYDFGDDKDIQALLSLLDDDDEGGDDD